MTLPSHPPPFHLYCYSSPRIDFVYFIGTSSWGKCSCFSGRPNSEVGHNPSLRHGDENRWVKMLCYLWQPQKKANCIAFIKSLAFYWRFFEGNGEFNKVTAFFNNSITEIVANRGIPQRHSSLMYCKTSRLQTQETIFFLYGSLTMSVIKFVILRANHNTRWTSNESIWFCELTRSGRQAREKHKRTGHELGLVLLLIGLESGARFFSQSQSTVKPR